MESETTCPQIIEVDRKALRLHLNPGQTVGKLNSYYRSTKGGRETAVKLCVYQYGKRITINEGIVNATGE